MDEDHGPIAGNAVSAGNATNASYERGEMRNARDEPCFRGRVIGMLLIVPAVIA
jgi:hypothetical protein